MAVVEITITGKDETGGIFDSVGSAIGGLATAAVAAAAALTALATAGLIASVNAAIQSEEAVARLEGILRATSDAAGVTSQELQDLANNLQLTTRYSDETILAGTSLLLTFRNIGEETLPRTIEAMLDMAEIFGSVDSSAMQLGKALNEPLTMLGSLTRAGVTFSEEQKEMIKGFVEMGDIASAQNIILSEVEAQVGRLAAAMGDTLAGKIDIAKNRIDTFAETIGGPFREILKLVVDDLMGFSDSPFIANVEAFFGRLTELLQNNITPLAALGVTFKEFADLSPMFEDIGNAILLFNSALGSGQSPLDAFKTSIETLLEMHPDGPLAPILTSIQDFITTGETMGWGEAISGLFDDVMQALDLPGKIQYVIDFLGPAIEDADWAGVASAITGIIETVLNGLYKVVDGVDWAPFGKSVLGAIGEAIAGVFGSTSWDDFAGDIGRGLVGIGEAIIDGIKEGINQRWENLKSVLSFGFDDVIAFVKRFFGITSPSTVFFGIGTDIVQGMIDGVGSMWQTFKDYISGLFKTLLRDFSIENIFNGLTGSDSAGIQGDSSSLLGSTGTLGGRSTSGSTTGTTVNQYFAGATINVGSWDQIAYDCLYPNPFISATSGQLGGSVNIK